jgi:DNA-binding transcriptional MerR regulator
MENRFTIGQMSKLHNIPVKTLRFYDEIGLFKPAEVDRENGYRYYSVEQFKVLDIINYLKMFGVPLKEIKKQISNRDIRDFLETMHHHKKITEATIAELEKAKKKLEERIREMERALQIESLGVPFFKPAPAKTVIRLREKIRSIYELEISLRKLKSQTSIPASIFIGKVGFTLPPDHFLQQNYEYSSIFLILEEAETVGEDTDLVFVIPEGLYACIYFRGTHMYSQPHVQKLHDFILENDYRVASDFFIRTIIDQYISSNPDEHLTEIRVLIEPNK